MGEIRGKSKNEGMKEFERLKHWLFQFTGVGIPVDRAGNCCTGKEV